MWRKPRSNPFCPLSFISFLFLFFSLKVSFLQNHIFSISPVFCFCSKLKLYPPRLHSFSLLSSKTDSPRAQLRSVAVAETPGFGISLVFFFFCLFCFCLCSVWFLGNPNRRNEYLEFYGGSGGEMYPIDVRCVVNFGQHRGIKSWNIQKNNEISWKLVKK